MSLFICGVIVGIILGVCGLFGLAAIDCKMNKIDDAKKAENDEYLENIGYMTWLRKRKINITQDHEFHDRLVRQIKNDEKLFYLIFKYDLSVCNVHGERMEKTTNVSPFVPYLTSIISLANITAEEREYINSLDQPKLDDVANFRNDFESKNFKKKIEPIVENEVYNTTKEYLK